MGPPDEKNKFVSRYRGIQERGKENLKEFGGEGKAEKLMRNADELLMGVGGKKRLCQPAFEKSQKRDRQSLHLRERISPFKGKGGVKNTGEGPIVACKMPKEKVAKKKECAPKVGEEKGD